MVLSMNGTFILEQPAQSNFEWFPRFRRIMEMSRVWKVAWYMLHYGSKTPKRHFAWSNSRAILRLSRGKLRGWKRPATGHTVKHYYDKKGRKRFCGTRLLKQTG